MEKLMLPRLGQTMEEGTVVEWLIAEGDSFEVGDVIYEVDTDKATVEIEATIAGTLGMILIDSGMTAPVGTVVGVALSESETADREEMRAFALGEAAQLSVNRSGSESDESNRRVGQPEPNPGEERRYTLSGHQRATARVLAQTWSEAPQFHQRFEVDASNVLASLDELRPKVQRDHGFRLSLTDLFVDAVLAALEMAPDVNATVSGEDVIVSPSVGMSIAIDTENGLVAPIIHDAEAKDLGARGTEFRDLIAKARSRSLAPQDVSGGTITISNLGMQGVQDGVALLTRPQVAAVFFGAIVERPFVVVGLCQARPTMFVSVTFDHRVIDGATGARFTTSLMHTLGDAAWD